MLWRYKGIVFFFLMQEEESLKGHKPLLKNMWSPGKLLNTPWPLLIKNNGNSHSFPQEEMELHMCAHATFFILPYILVQLLIVLLTFNQVYRLSMLKFHILAGTCLSSLESLITVKQTILANHCNTVSNIQLSYLLRTQKTRQAMLSVTILQKCNSAITVIYKFVIVLNILDCILFLIFSCDQNEYQPFAKG